MNYIQVVDLVFSIILTVFGLMGIQFLFFGILGLFCKKKFPKAEKKLKYGIVIAARNEEKVIENLIKSVQKNDYPQDKLQIFVVAHNCTDKTAEVARAAGATVYEYNNPEERTKGYAFKYLFQQIETDYGTKSYDGFFVFDADNILSKDYFDKMNDAFVYYNGERVITSYRNSKNFGTNTMSAAYGLYFLLSCRFEFRSRSVLGCSTRVSGTGFLFSPKVVENGWNYVTLVEDWEFSADQVLQGRNIVYCDDAILYDEQPTNHKTMIRQRLRWQKGHLMMFFKVKALIKRLFTKTPKEQKNNKFSIYDMAYNTLPVFTITASIFILNWLFILLTPIFMPNVFLSVWQSHLINLAWTTLEWYLSLVFIAILIYLCERKRIKNVPFMTKVFATLYFPIFMFLAIPLEVIAAFMKIDWKTISHTDTTNFEKVNQVTQTAVNETVNEVETSANTEKN